MYPDVRRKKVRRLLSLMEIGEEDIWKKRILS
jgi:hypothetical protein